MAKKKLANVKGETRQKHADKNSSNKKQDGQSNNTTKVDKTKFKTELCKNWIETRICRYGSKCQFAHGYHELAKKDSEELKFKNRVCKSFHNRGYCTYGTRCLFKHEDRKFEVLHKYHYVFALSNLHQRYTTLIQESQMQPEFMNHTYDNPRVSTKRLSIFQNMTEETEIRPLKRCNSNSSSSLSIKSDDTLSSFGSPNGRKGSFMAQQHEYVFLCEEDFDQQDVLYDSYEFDNLELVRELLD